MVTDIRKAKRKGKETGIWNKEAEVSPTSLPTQDFQLKRPFPAWSHLLTPFYCV